MEAHLLSGVQELRRERGCKYVLPVYTSAPAHIRQPNIWAQLNSWCMISYSTSLKTESKVDLCASEVKTKWSKQLYKCQ